MGGFLEHDGNPCMAWTVGNTATKENAWREIRPVKLAQRKRIDGMVALIDGVAKMLKAPDDTQPAWQTEGLLVLG